MANTQCAIENATTEQLFYSQDQEDRFAYNNFFYDRFHGVYLELGAHDGVRYSNSKFFSDSLGWSGVLIEANPTQYARVSEGRPSSLAINAAVCARHTTVHYVYSDRPLTDEIWEYMSAGFRERWHGSAVSLPITAKAVPCLPLQAILEKVAVYHIDFFSLDVEGAELEVLQTLDFTSLHVDVICVEQDGSDPDKDDQIRVLLRATGFELKLRAGQAHGTAISRNDWFVNKHFVPTPAPPGQEGI